MKQLSTAEIYSLVSKYTSRFKKEDDEKLAFQMWARRTRPELLEQAAKRRRGTEEKSVAVRNVFVLDKSYWETVADTIINAMKKHLARLELWSTSSFEIIGYVRKSKTPFVPENIRVNNVQKMINILKERSNVDYVFASVNSQSTEAISSRDMTKIVEVASSLSNCRGNTQDMLKYLRTCKKQVVLVCLTFAGFTTVPNDLRDFLMHHKNVEHAVIDDYGSKQRFCTYSRAESWKTVNRRTSVGQRFK